MLYFSKLFRIKQGKLEIFTDWLNTINGPLKEEALTTLTQERVTRETYVLFRNKNQDIYYVVGLNEALDTPLDSDPNISINQKHKQIKSECLEPISNPGEIILNLTTLEP